MFNLKDYNSSEEQSDEQGPVEMRVTLLQHAVLEIITNLEYLATISAVPNADIAADPISEGYLLRAKGLRALVDKDIKEVEESEAIELSFDELKKVHSQTVKDYHVVASKLDEHYAGSDLSESLKQTVLDWAIRYDKLKQASVELCTEYDKVRTKLVKYADTIDTLTDENEALKATLELKFKGKATKHGYNSKTKSGVFIID